MQRRQYHAAVAFSGDHAGKVKYEIGTNLINQAQGVPGITQIDLMPAQVWLVRPIGPGSGVDSSTGPFQAVGQMPPKEAACPGHEDCRAPH
jgi:hypothetical protein